MNFKIQENMLNEPLPTLGELEEDADKYSEWSKDRTKEEPRWFIGIDYITPGSCVFYRTSTRDNTVQDHLCIYGGVKDGVHIVYPQKWTRVPTRPVSSPLGALAVFEWADMTQHYHAWEEYFNQVLDPIILHKGEVVNLFTEEDPESYYAALNKHVAHCINSFDACLDYKMHPYLAIVLYYICATNFYAGNATESQMFSGFHDNEFRELIKQGPETWWDEGFKPYQYIRELSQRSATGNLADLNLASLQLKHAADSCLNPQVLVNAALESTILPITKMKAESVDEELRKKRKETTNRIRMFLALIKSTYCERVITEIMNTY